MLLPWHTVGQVAEMSEHVQRSTNQMSQTVGGWTNNSAHYSHLSVINVVWYHTCASWIRWLGIVGNTVFGLTLSVECELTRLTPVDLVCVRSRRLSPSPYPLLIKRRRFNTIVIIHNFQDTFRLGMFEER